MVDVSAPSAEDHAAHVRKVLADIEAAQVPQLLVLNKIDRLPEWKADLDALCCRLSGGGAIQAQSRCVAVSALTGAGIDQLLRCIDGLLALDPIIRDTLRLPLGDGAALSLLHEFARVIHIRYHPEFCEVEAEMPESLRRRLTDLK